MTEMFDKWDELWNREIPESELDRLVNTDWLHEVKAEGDKLRRALVQLEIPERMEMHEQLEAARERVRNGLLQADAPLWFLRSLQRDLGVSEE